MLAEVPLDLFGMFFMDLELLALKSHYIIIEPLYYYGTKSPYSGNRGKLLEPCHSY